MRRWALFALSIVLMGLWFPRMFFRADERPLLRDGFGLFTRLGDQGSGDSVEEAFANVGKGGQWLHSIKNILHEWTKESPKRAAKFLSFVIVAEAIAIGVLL